MAHLVVRVAGQSEQGFKVEGEEILVGRDGEAHLLLPNVSVSRFHARISRVARQWQITDLKSRNGLLVNGKPVLESPLKNGDEITIGKYLLVFLGDERDDQIYNGRFVSYLPRYEPYREGGSDSTFMLKPGELKRMKEEAWKMREAQIVAVLDSRQTWKPGDKGIAFGGAATIPVKGRFTSGEVATITWIGGYHVLEKRGRFAKVEVNGNAITQHRLRAGETIQVGATRFRYVVPKM